MGAVYRAQDLRFKVEKIVAVKEMINKATDSDIQATIVETFEREANILATVSHPSIPTIYDYFTLGARSYLVMEFIDGDNLEIKLQQRRAPFQEEEAIGWAIALCDVLDYLHTHFQGYQASQHYDHQPKSDQTGRLRDSKNLPHRLKRNYDRNGRVFTS